MKTIQYDLYKIAEGKDKFDNEFITVLVFRRSSDKKVFVAVFNCPSCYSCPAGITFNSKVKTLESFLDTEKDSVINELKYDGYSSIIKNIDENGKEYTSALLRRFPKDY